MKFQGVTEIVFTLILSWIISIPVAGNISAKRKMREDTLLFDVSNLFLIIYHLRKSHYRIVVYFLICIIWCSQITSVIWPYIVLVNYIHTYIYIYIYEERSTYTKSKSTRLIFITLIARLVTCLIKFISRINHFLFKIPINLINTSLFFLQNMLNQTFKYNNNLVFKFQCCPVSTCFTLYA